MNKTLISFILLFAGLALSGQGVKNIVILHTNDLHSQLSGYPPESNYTPLVSDNDGTSGGFSRIASILKEEREANKGITLTLDAGDFLMGSLFHSLEVQTGFQLHLMKKMGYDIVCVGNHEFDFGPGKLASIIRNAAAGIGMPSLLFGNVLFDNTDPSDDALESLYSGDTLKQKLIITREGLKIGIFSLLGKDAVDVAPGARPVRFSNQISFARRMVKELTEAECDIIICLSHSGVSKDKNGTWAGEDADLAGKVKGIDVIVSGHTHTRLEAPLMIEGIPVVQAGEYGRSVGRLEMEWNNGVLSFKNYKLIPVDDNTIGDQEIESEIRKQQQLISDEILEPNGYEYSKIVAEAGFLLECDVQGDFIGSNLGPLVADAIHSYVNRHSVAGCDISMVSAGVIRDKIVPGYLTAPDIFRVMSLGAGNDNIPGYPLARLYVTGKELKSILEILLVAYRSSADYYCYYSGIKVSYDPSGGLLRKIKRIEIVHPGGVATEVDFSKHNETLYSVTANSYMLEFIGIIKKMSLGLVNVVPKDASGIPVTDVSKAVIDVNEDLNGIQEGKEWLALIEFICSMKDFNGNGMPDIEDKYSSPVQTFFPSDH